MQPTLVDSLFVDAANVTAGGSSHTKGAWTELIASASAQADLLVVTVAGVSVNNTATAMLLDIGKGASGSETAIASNIAVGGAMQTTITVERIGLSLVSAIPVNIPSGTRISARTQALIASDTAFVSVQLYSFGDSSLVPSTADVLGTSTGTSAGTNLSASNAWTEMVGSTSQDYIAFCVVPSISTATTNLNETAIYEIGVGAAGSEVAFGQLPVFVRSTEGIFNIDGQILFFGKEVSSGSRIAVRQNTVRTFFDATVIAIPKP
jgi:hypothetical protein